MLTVAELSGVTAMIDATDPGAYGSAMDAINGKSGIYLADGAGNPWGDVDVSEETCPTLMASNASYILDSEARRVLGIDIFRPGVIQQTSKGSNAFASIRAVDGKVPVFNMADTIAAYS